MRKKERFVLGKRTFRSQKSKHFVLRIIPGDILFVLSLVAGTRDVSSFQPFFIVGHFAVVLPIAFGRGKCEAGDGSAPDDADIGAVADDGRCSECH